MSGGSIYVPGLSHGEHPIPTARSRGPLLVTGGIRGVDIATGQMPQDVARQTRLALENLRTVVMAAGGSLDDIVHVTVFAADDSVRDALNEAWVAAFPDPESRPARHLQRVPLPKGLALQLEATAYILDGAGK